MARDGYEVGPAVTPPCIVRTVLPTEKQNRTNFLHFANYCILLFILSIFNLYQNMFI